MDKKKEFKSKAQEKFLEDKKPQIFKDMVGKENKALPMIASKKGAKMGKGMGKDCKKK